MVAGESDLVALGRQLHVIAYTASVIDQHVYVISDGSDLVGQARIEKPLVQIRADFVH